jgi:hypothetical protein
MGCLAPKPGVVPCSTVQDLPSWQFTGAVWLLNPEAAWKHLDLDGPVGNSGSCLIPYPGAGLPVFQAVNPTRKYTMVFLKKWMVTSIRKPDIFPASTMLCWRIASFPPQVCAGIKKAHPPGLENLWLVKRK